MTYPEQESISIAEQAAIGSILLDSHVFFEVESIIAADDFASKDLSTVFLAFKELASDGIEISVISTSECLSRKGKLDKLGGPAFLMGLCDNIGSSSQAGYFANKILSASIARKYAQTCKLFQIESKQAAEGKAPLSTILAKHIQEINKISHFATDNCNKIDWFNAKPDNIYKVLWPLGIHEYVNIFPKNIVVIGGASNSGKTGFMLNVAYDNRHHHHIRYFSSEMGPEELRLRLQLFGHKLKDWNCVEFIDRSSNFAPAIDPDALNIIDYLEITDNFYQIGGEIKAIFDRLRNGIAVIGIQKKSGTDYARGGEFTLEKARLYVSLDYNVAKIVKGKNWGRHGNPKDIQFEFNLSSGCNFELVAIKDADGNYRG